MMRESAALEKELAEAQGRAKEAELELGKLTVEKDKGNCALDLIEPSFGTQKARYQDLCSLCRPRLRGRAVLQP